MSDPYVNYAETVIQAQSGDVAAFDVLVRRFQDQAVGYARSLLADATAAEDAAQEAFVEAFLCLHNLREPLAFPVFLRRIVHKQCDRVRRVTHPPLLDLNSAAEVAGGTEPLQVLLKADTAGRVRTALQALPPREREVAWLYYLGGQDVAEVAAFLEVPPSTVKNRLHTARKRLRKELWEMAEDLLTREKPSRNEEFAGKVVAAIVGEFERQRRADPHTADRSLLTEGRAKLDALMEGKAPLDWYAVWSGFRLLMLQNEPLARAELLGRYLSQDIPISDAAWAHYHRTNALACGGDAAAAVAAQNIFVEFMVGKHPHLQHDWPFGPIPAEDPNCLPDDVLPFWLWCKSGEFARAYQILGRTEEFIAAMENAFRTVPPSPTNRLVRFYCLRMMFHLRERLGEEESARGYLARMHALADEEAEPSSVQYWHVLAFGHESDLLRSLGRADAANSIDEEILQRLETPWDVEPTWLRGERHDLAHRMTMAGNYAKALQIFEEIQRTGGPVNSWGYLIYASAVWGATGDRARTLDLIREAACRDHRDVQTLFQQIPNLAEMAQDPEFISAAQKLG